MALHSAVAQRYIYSAMLITICAMAALLWMPSMLGAMAPGYGLDATRLSHLACSSS
jgi:hypothetical protein